jgi:enoyl-CoA hydratase/carnithine racemase
MNGAAIGAGLELALACDLRVAVRASVLAFPEVELGIIPANGGTQRLPRIVGVGRALELILLAKRLTAEEALAYGLVHGVCAEGQAVKEALGMGAKILESAPIAVRQAKLAIRFGVDRPFEQGLQLEGDAFRPCLYSKDRLEGVKAFVEKRKPVYRGE